MTDTDTEELRAALAAGPTPGKWELWGKPDPSQVIAAGNGFVAQTLGGNDLPNAAYIAACHPERIARLLDALDEARKDAERWRGLYRKAVNEANGLTNYVEDRPELRRAERNLTAIESEARAIAMKAAP